MRQAPSQRPSHGVSACEGQAGSPFEADSARRGWPKILRTGSAHLREPDSGRDAHGTGRIDAQRATRRAHAAAVGLGGA